MASLLMVVLGRESDLPALLAAWQEVRVPGVTVVPCGGESWARSWLAALGLKATASDTGIPAHSHRMVLAVIQDGKVLDAAVAEARRTVGGFGQPGSGVLLVLPVETALGLHGPREATTPAVAEAGLPPATDPEWLVKRDTPVSVVASVMDLQPTIVSIDAPLDEVALAMLEHPAVHVACVVNEDRRLKGLIDLRLLADHLFFHILPEEFIGEISDLDEAMEFANATRARTAEDAMKAPAWIRPDETVKEAFRRMHDHRMPGLPIVDEGYRVVGYINLLELLAITEGAPHLRRKVDP